MKRRPFPPFDEDQLEELGRRATDITGTSGKVDYHHAVLTKRHVQGMPDEERAKINNPCNIILVDHSFHLDRTVPTGQDAVQYLLLARYKNNRLAYSRADILEWWKSIQWKSKPPFVLV